MSAHKNKDPTKTDRKWRQQQHQQNKIFLLCLKPIRAQDNKMKALGDLRLQMWAGAPNFLDKRKHKIEAGWGLA